MKNRKLRTEKLESRKLFAGDVMFSQGVLTVEMDEAGRNDLRVFEVGGYVRVTGNASLSATGHDRVRADQVDRIVVNGTSGADQISLSGVRNDNFPSLDQTVIRAGGGNDKVIGSAAADIIFGGRGHDELHGLDGNDTLRGGRGHDRLFGGEGVDRLYGGRDNDWLWGAAYHRDDTSRDFAYGGRGYDTYGFANANIGVGDKIKQFEKDSRG